jgi:hypothetical protein
MPTRCKIAAWPYQCLLTQNADRCSRAAGILARARLLLVVASIIRGDGPNELCESIDQRARKVPQKQCAARLSSAAMVVCRRVPATGHGGARGAAQRSAPTWKVARRCQGTIGTDRTAQSGRQRLSALKASRAPVGEEDLSARFGFRVLRQQCDGHRRDLASTTRTRLQAGSLEYCVWAHILVTVWRESTLFSRAARQLGSASQALGRKTAAVPWRSPA